MNSEEKLALINNMIEARMRTTRLLAAANIKYIVDRDHITKTESDPVLRQKKIEFLTDLLMRCIRSLLPPAPACECGEVDADATPLEPRGPVDITMPSRGPWRAAPHPLELDGKPICTPVMDAQGELVKGLLICAGMDQPAIALANVNLVLAAPRLLASLMRVTRLLHVKHEETGWAHGPSDTLHDPALLENLDEVLEAATPIRTPKQTGEGGAP